MENTYKIIPVNSHYEAFNASGQFVVSGDTREECEQELLGIIFSEAQKSDRKGLIA